jgi:D-alanyl-D-alanine carboxypeptidase (penicillin-binding protein 5/6)
LAAGVLWLAAGSAFAASNPVTGEKKEDFKTSAPYAILIEAESGTVLFEKAADEPTPPSSLAKLMTQELVFHALQTGQIKLGDLFTVSEDAWRRGGAPSHTSSMFAPIHSQVSVDDLLHGAIIQSANDGCIALAEGLNGSESAFADRMNDRAKELGLTGSTFANATGLPDPRNKVTMRDLGKLALHIIRTYPEYYKLYGEKEFTFNKIRQQNRNPLLAMNIGADGLKTGFTNEGGYGLVGSATQNGMRLIVAINGLKSDKERAEEGRKLIEWGFRGFDTKILFAEGQTVGEAKLYGGEQGSVPLVGAGEIRLMVPRDSRDRINAKIVYRGPVRAPIERGQTIATLRVFRGDRVALEVPLQAAEDVGQGGLARRAFDAASELVIGWVGSLLRSHSVESVFARQGSKKS